MLLEKKLYELDKMVRANSTDVGENIGVVEDVVVQYNKIISIYLNPANTQQTKTVILTAIMKIEGTVKAIGRLLLTVLNTAVTNAAGYRRVFQPCLKAYIVYDLIESQLRSGSFMIISNEDLERHMRKVVNSHPQWRRIGAARNLSLIHISEPTRPY